MSNEMLYCVRLEDRSGNFDLAAEMLSALELDFSSWEDRESRRIFHTAYAETPEDARDNRARIEEAIRDWTPLGVDIGDIEAFEMKKEEWSEVWKRYFHLIPISDRLIIKPSWLECPPKPGQKILEIDPGMSFGTGQHATTLFCLEMIDKCAAEGGAFLDAGCGSGILAIGAALLGFDPVDAFDYDPDAVRIAAENLELNHIAKVRPVEADAAVFRGREGGYDFVCANILGHLLKAYRKNIASWVRSGGRLALAGILTEEYPALRTAFEELGFTEVENKTLREWTSGLFLKR